MYKSIFKAYSKVSISLLILFIFQLSACQEKPPLKLTSSQRDQLDTLYAQAVGPLAEELDSICEQMFATRLDNMVDSLLKVRQQQEDNLRQKYRK